MTKIMNSGSTLDQSATYHKSEDTLDSWDTTFSKNCRNNRATKTG